MKKLEINPFYADDTLWVNEPYFQAAEKKFCDLLEEYLPHHTVSRELLQTEIQNLGLYGYGVKSFILSMVETALRISDYTIGAEAIERIIGFGKEQLQQPIELLDGVEEVLHQLEGSFRLVVATKGDLLDQERKLEQSGLAHFFHHIEIMSEKGERDYKKLLAHLDIEPESFLMIGNSIKSDVLPVLNIGGYGIHVPYHTTWALEKVEKHIDDPNFRQVDNIRQVLELIERS